MTTLFIYIIKIIERSARFLDNCISSNPNILLQNNVVGPLNPQLKCLCSFLFVHLRFCYFYEPLDKHSFYIFRIPFKTKYENR